MSQRRRRRRRRGGGGASRGASGGEQKATEQQPRASERAPSGKRRRRKRRRGPGEPSSPKSSEDLVRALPRERPESLTAPGDGTDLDELIGELQSTWGVPQYPQEYRLVLKIGDGKERVSTPAAENGDAQAPSAEGAPKREKAPPPRVLAGDGDGGARKRRRKRRRRGRGNSGGAP